MKFIAAMVALALFIGALCTWFAWLGILGFWYVGPTAKLWVPFVFYTICIGGSIVGLICLYRNED